MGSAEFEQFLDLLGDRIELEGWENFKGGLDTKSTHVGLLKNFTFESLLFSTTDNSTGKQSLYTVFQGHEVMFHVSTLLPYHAENKQQVSKNFCSLV